MDGRERLFVPLSQPWRVGSLCSGYEGLGTGLAMIADIEHTWFSEVDPSACAVLEARFPGVPNLGDLTSIDWKEINHMAAHRNDAKAQAMYDRYCQGLSLAGVAAEFDVTRQCVFKYFERRGWDMRPRPPARPTVEFAGRRFSIGDNGYYRATDGDREYLHRAMWAAANGTIPADHDIHHRDFDKTHNELSNFECIRKDDHARLYGTGCNGSVHHCGKGVVPPDSPAVDVLTAGYP